MAELEEQLRAAQGEATQARGDGSQVEQMLQSLEKERCDAEGTDTSLIPASRRMWSGSGGPAGGDPAGPPRPLRASESEDAAEQLVELLGEQQTFVSAALGWRAAREQVEGPAGEREDGEAGLAE
jgi:hypothetical protein